MIVAENDNQTAEAHRAGLPANPYDAVARVQPEPSAVSYELVVRDRQFLLTRIGMTKIMPEMRDREPVYSAFPTCAVPHRFSPPHDAERARAAAAAPKPKHPSFIRGVISRAS